MMLMLYNSARCLESLHVCLLPSLSLSLSSPLSPCHPVLSFPFDPLPPLPPPSSQCHSSSSSASLSLSLLLACRPPSLPARPTRLSVRGCGGGDLKEVEDVSGRADGERRRRKDGKRIPCLSLSPPSNSDPLSQPSSLTDCNLGLRIDAFPAC